MRRLIVICLFSVSSIFLPAATPQANTPPAAAERSSQALAVLAQVLNTAGGPAITGIQDFTALGDITVYSAGKELQGHARVLARGQDQFRFDEYLSMGTRSWAVSNRSGELKDSDGKVSSIPPHNAMTLGSLTFPYLRLLAAAGDNTTAVQDLGDLVVESQKLHKLHVHRDFDSSFGGDNAVNHLSDADYLFDSQTHLLASVRNQTHPVESMAKDVPHEVQFSDYRNVNGVMVPFGVTEYIGGQRVWTLQLSSIQFNTGLSDSDFSF